MKEEEAVTWLSNLCADIGKTEHRDLWHYRQALAEIARMFESKAVSDLISRRAAIFALHDEIVARRLDGREQIDEFDTESILKQLPPAESNFIPLKKQDALQAGKEGRELNFYIGGRLFAVREKAQ